ncbi:MAG: arginine deiminase-related protein [Bacteroidota bacterium]|nr:arginine deiminase-related protein [Bacteroidota bacterium]HHU96245.1 amidinotransferase [Petrimonas sp.]
MQTTSKLLMIRPARFAYNEETAKNNFFQRDYGDYADDGINGEDGGNEGKGGDVGNWANGGYGGNDGDGSNRGAGIDKARQETVAEKALVEFDAFVELLRRNDVDVTVVQDTLEPWTPDSLFPNNWFSSHLSGELVLYPMFAENRRQERKPHVLELLRGKMNHRKVVDLTSWEEEGQFLEGTGSMVFDRRRRKAYCCRSPRSSERVLADFCARMRYDAVAFDAFDVEGRPLYHTNIMMEVGTQVAVVCLDSIKEANQRERVAAELTAAGKVIVELSIGQLTQFAGNMLEVKSRNGHPFMVMSAAARDSLTSSQERTISTYNKILSTDLHTIETYGGGSARCMLAEIFH